MRESYPEYVSSFCSCASTSASAAIPTVTVTDTVTTTAAATVTSTSSVTPLKTYYEIIAPLVVGTLVAVNMDVLLCVYLDTGIVILLRACHVLAKCVMRRALG